MTEETKTEETPKEAEAEAEEELDEEELDAVAGGIETTAKIPREPAQVDISATKLDPNSPALVGGSIAIVAMGGKTRTPGR